MESQSRRKATRERKTRTNRDVVMIMLGALLVLFFVAAGYSIYGRGSDGSTPRFKGPVRNPNSQNLMERRFDQFAPDQVSALRPGASSIVSFHSSAY